MKIKKGKKLLQIHPPPKVMDKNFHRRHITSQAQETDQVLQRHKKIHMYGDEDKGESKGDVLNYDLMIFIDLKPSYFQKTYFNDVWVESMKEEINSIEKNDTWELIELPKENKYVSSN